MGVIFLREPMCAEGMGCGRRWVRWVLRGTGIGSVLKDFTEDALTISAGSLFQNGKANNISVGGTCRRDRVAFCMLDV